MELRITKMELIRLERLLAPTSGDKRNEIVLLESYVMSLGRQIKTFINCIG